MLWSLIFMRGQIHNATPIPNRSRGGLPKRDVTSHVTRQLTCPEMARSERRGPTLADGHTMPSRIAVTPAPSPKREKLMDTLSHGIQRCNIDVTYACRPPIQQSPMTSRESQINPIHPHPYSIHLLRKKSSQVPRNQRDHQKLLDTLLICSGTQKEEAGRG
jgi:hypothetical protein